MRPKTAVLSAIIFSGTVGLNTTTAWPQGQPGNPQPSPTFPRGSQPPGAPTEPGPGPQNQQQLPRDPLTQPDSRGIDPRLPGTTGQPRQQQPSGSLQTPGSSTLPGATGRDPFTQPNLGGSGPGQTQNLPGGTSQQPQRPGDFSTPAAPGATTAPGAAGDQLKGGSSRGDTQMEKGTQGPTGTEMSGQWSKDEIRKVQQALQGKGFDPGTTDGVLSSRTQEAVRSFQMANGLRATGTLNAETAAKLGVQQGVSSLPQSGSSIESPSGASGKSSIEGSAGTGSGSSMGTDQKSGTSGTSSPRSGPGSSRSSGGSSAGSGQR